MSLPDSTSVARLTVGTAGSTFPAWHELLVFVGGAWPFFIQALGFVVLVLTIRKLWLENRKLDREKPGGER